MNNKDRSSGEDILYHIIQKKIIGNNAINPPEEVKYMIEQLLLWGGIWFKPEAYEIIPVLLPYVVRDSSCRKKTSTGKDTRGEANARGFMKDDNSSIKGIPKSLKIESTIPMLKGNTMGNGFVAAHAWIHLQNKPNTVHACNWECGNSFIPNLVWLPKQLAKLTDVDGSYAQKFIQHISGLLYRKINFEKQMINDIWTELKDPGITPVSIINLNDLNFFENDMTWMNKRKTKLNKELISILNILNGTDPIIEPINCSSYIPSLQLFAINGNINDKEYMRDWITANL